ncbi:MAG: hypothetical protein ACOX2A_05475 [Tepidanaerobacteraceae bacterium]
MLASYYGLDIHWKDKLPIDIQKTAGPSTCILVTGPTGLENLTSSTCLFIGRTKIKESIVKFNIVLRHSLIAISNIYSNWTAAPIVPGPV